MKGIYLIVPLRATRNQQMFDLGWLQFDYCTVYKAWCTCGVWLSSVMHTAEFFYSWFLILDSAVWWTLWSPTQRSNAHSEVWLCGVMHTSESNSSMMHTSESLTLQFYDNHYNFFRICFFTKKSLIPKNHQILRLKRTLKPLDP